MITKLEKQLKNLADQIKQLQNGEEQNVWGRFEAGTQKNPLLHGGTENGKHRVFYQGSRRVCHRLKKYQSYLA